MNSKEMNAKYERFIKNAARDIRSTGDCSFSELVKLVECEMKLFNGVWGSMNHLRTQVVLACMESYINTAKATGIYCEDIVRALGRNFGSVCMRRKVESDGR